MSLLQNAIPTEAIEKHFPNSKEVVCSTTPEEFLIKEPNKIPSTCLFIWDEMVDRKLIKEPFKIAPIINSGYAGIYEFVSKELKEPAFRDAYSVRFYNEYSEESFVDVCLVHCYPSDIHICDVEFSDNRKPIPDNDPSSQYRAYRGLKIFPDFLEKLQQTAKEKQAERISLMVACPPLHSVFAKYGFVIGKSEMAKRAYKRSKAGHSMYLPVN